MELGASRLGRRFLIRKTKAAAGASSPCLRYVGPRLLRDGSRNKFRSGRGRGLAEASEASDHRERPARDGPSRRRAGRHAHLALAGTRRSRILSELDPRRSGSQRHRFGAFRRARLGSGRRASIVRSLPTVSTLFISRASSTTATPRRSEKPKSNGAGMKRSATWFA